MAGGPDGVKGGACGRCATPDTARPARRESGMNATTDTPRPPLPAHRLLAHDLALEAAAAAIALAATVSPRLRPLADQSIRSAASVPANLAEGRGRSGRDRIHHFRIAYGSALEAGSHLELLAAAGAVNRERAREALELLDRVRALTWRLIHPRR